PQASICRSSSASFWGVTPNRGIVGSFEGLWAFYLISLLGRTAARALGLRSRTTTSHAAAKLSKAHFRAAACPRGCWNRDSNEFTSPSPDESRGRFFMGTYL